MKFVVFLLSGAFLPALFQAEYTKLEWSDCGSREVVFYNIDVTPMPILQPGNAFLNFKAQLKRDIEGDLKTDLSIIRTVSGVKLPIRW